MDRNQRVEIAGDTKRLLEDCQYVAEDKESGKQILVTLKGVIDEAKRCTVLHLAEEEFQVPKVTSPKQTNIIVTNETTLECMSRLNEDGACGKIAVLNFASAKSAGGGLHRGSWEQEENLVAATGLLECLSTEQAKNYYELHKELSKPGKGRGILLYSSMMVYSPDVPVFRDSDMKLLARPFTCSFISASCVNYNTGIFNKNVTSAEEERAVSIMNARALRVLQVAVHHGVDTIVLGPWGCGINKNPPKRMAKSFNAALLHPDMKGRFDNVIFAVPNEKTSKVYQEFAKIFV